ncbi:hypothetical protein ARMGADRAFT_1035430 [Armillaria gallica]|uniref:Uncharacterized protein n=1 Tax=Armillaria gallica TaxID=47427 RepID=A0A2H3D563_ARMGA|nr:hypothetical protein ARMGADRAFT_1035430 [Armillaria gallica]
MRGCVIFWDILNACVFGPNACVVSNNVCVSFHNACVKTCESTTYRTFSKIHACGLPVVLSWEVNYNNGLISNAPKRTKRIPPKRTKRKKTQKRITQTRNSPGPSMTSDSTVNQLSNIAYYMNPVTPQNCWTPILTYSVVCKIAEDFTCVGGHLVMLLGRHLYEEKALPMLSAPMVFSVGDSCIRNSLRRVKALESSWMAAVTAHAILGSLAQPRHRGYELLTSSVHIVLRLSRKWEKATGK